MVTSIFNQETGILESAFTDEVTLQEIVDYIISTKENKTFPRTLKIKTNATKANFNFSIDDLETIVNENEKSLEKYEFIIDAIIVDDPKTTMISMLYQRLEKNKKYKFEIFSTAIGASKWLENF